MKKTILLIQKLTLVSGLIILGFTSCKKEEVKPDTSLITFKHVSPDLAVVDVALDGKWFKAPGLTYNNKINEMEVTAGVHTIMVKNGITGAIILNSTISLLKERSYTYYIANRAAAVDGVLIDNPKTESVSEKANVRILNLSHDGPAYNVSFTGVTANAFSGLTYRIPSTFTTLNAPKNGAPLNLQVKHPTTNAIVANINTTIFSGKTYTIVLRGFTTPPTGNTNTLGFTMLNVR